MDVSKWIERIKNSKEEIEKLLILGAWLSEEAKKRGVKPPIIVGGSAVEIYTFGRYVSGDVDFVGSREFIKNVLLSSGFFREEGRFFISEELDLFVEVPDSVLAGSYNKVRVIRVPELESEVYVIGIEDLIVDRLSACVFRKSQEDCTMAEYLFRKYRDYIDLSYLKERAREERVSEKLESILNKEEGFTDVGKGNSPES